MQENSPRHLLISVVIVGGAVLFMWVLKNVFQIQSHHSSADTSSYIAAHSEEAQEPLQEVSEHGSQESTDQQPSETEPDNEDPVPAENEGTVNESAEPDETQPAPAEVDDETISYFETLLVDYQSKIENLNPGENRTDIVVRYYTHEPDDDKINVLKGLGLYIHRRTPDSELEGYESNSIYYGDSVSNEDIRLVAYTLLTNGFDVKQIIPSKFHDSWKAKSIEIGTDLEIVGRRNLSPAEIRNFYNEFYPN